MSLKMLGLTLVEASATPPEWRDGRPLLCFVQGDHPLDRFLLNSAHGADARWTVVRWADGEWVVLDTEREGEGYNGERYHHGDRVTARPDYLAELPVNLEHTELSA